MALVEIITRPASATGISLLRSGRKRLSPTSAGHRFDAQSGRSVAGRIGYTRRFRLPASTREQLVWFRWAQSCLLQCLGRFMRPGGPLAEKVLGQNRESASNLRRYSAAFWEARSRLASSYDRGWWCTRRHGRWRICSSPPACLRGNPQRNEPVHEIHQAHRSGVYRRA